MSPRLQNSLHSPLGFAQSLVTFEVIVISVFALIISFILLFKSLKDGTIKTRSETFFLPVALVITAIILVTSSLPFVGEKGRTILSFGPLNPGSTLAHISTFGSPFWISRILQPSVWLLTLALAFLSSKASPGKALSKISILFWLASVYLECIYLIDPTFVNLLGSNRRWLLNVLHFVTLQLFFISLIATIYGIAVLHRTPLATHSNGQTIRRFVYAYLGLFILLALPALLSSQANPKLIMAGAHYYSWFPENWKAGILGDRTIPTIEPEIGKYATLGPKVFHQHVTWAKEAGLKFFIFDYWPGNSVVRSRVKELAKRTATIPNFQFSLHYEPMDLKEPGDAQYPGEGANIIYLDQTRTERLMKHWLRIAKNYMSNPSYLRIDGRPVIFLYSTRHLVGPVAEGIQRAKEFVLQNTNEDIFIVGDEVYFNVLDYNHKVGVKMNKDFIPNWERLSVFDAITCYNPYEANKLEFAGDAGANTFIDSSRELFAIYQSYAKTLGQSFVPVAMPGYNDRGVRLAENHYVVPRSFLPAQPLGSESSNSGAQSSDIPKQSFFTRSLEEWTAPFLQSPVQMIAITSWNEWNEWTAIEPSKLSPETNLDNSPDQITFTQGERHSGYGKQHLAELRSFLDKLALFHRVQQ